MAEEPKTASTEPGKTVTGSTGDTGAAPSKTDEWKAIVDNKYASEADLAKAHKELEKKLSEQGEEIKKAREFATVMQPLLSEIQADEEIFQKLDKKLRAKQGDPAAKDDKTDKPAPQGEEVRSVAGDMILARFEEKYGITGLPETDRKEMRRKIGDTVYRLTGTPFNKVDLRRLDSVLEDAYYVANKDKVIDTAKLEALTSARQNSEAGISSIRSNKSSSEETLTDEEIKVAERMGLSREQYLKGKRKTSR